MNQLHEKFGLNPTLEVCRHCHHGGAIIFHGDNVPGQAAAHEMTECNNQCVVLGLVVLVENRHGHETGYTISATFEEAKKQIFKSLKRKITKPGKYLVSISEMKEIMGDNYRKPGTIDL